MCNIRRVLALSQCCHSRTFKWCLVSGNKILVKAFQWYVVDNPSNGYTVHTIIIRPNLNKILGNSYISLGNLMAPSLVHS
jgi:hypothetical protein